MSVRKIDRLGFTIIEMLAVIMIIGVLVVILLPGIQSTRERARQVSCSNNLMQIGLAVTAYHAAFEQLPTQMSGTDGSTVIGADNDRRLSFFVALLPFLGHEAMLEQLRGPLPVETDTEYGMYMSADEETMAEGETDQEQAFWVPGGPEPFTNNYQIWRLEIPEFRCPSDPGYGRPALQGRNNYAACLGDGIVAMDTGPLKEVNGVFVWDQQRAAQTEAAMRGAFVPRFVTRFGDITDGLSSTLLLAEIATDLRDRDIRTAPWITLGEAILRDQPNRAYDSDVIDSERPLFWQTSALLMTDGDPSVARGFRWADGAAVFTGFNTILPPNHAIVLSQQKEDSSGVLPPSSRHQGGVGVCLADGSIRFITDSIDAGDRHSPTPYVGSPNAPGQKSVYGLWGAMGTRASAELAMDDDAL